MSPSGGDIERRRDDDLERPPMAWLPVVIIGGLAVFGAWSLFTFVIGAIGAIVKFAIIGGIVALIGWILVKGYKGPPDS